MVDPVIVICLFTHDVYGLGRYYAKKSIKEIQGNQENICIKEQLIDSEQCPRHCITNSVQGCKCIQNAFARERERLFFVLHMNPHTHPTFFS